MSLLFFVIIGLLLFGFTITALILPWIHRHDIKNLQQSITKMQNQISLLKESLQEKNIPISDIDQKQTTVKTTSPLQHELITPTTPANNSSAKLSTSTVIKATKSRIGFEQQFGARLPVWIGSIALALAGFFLVKYSIEAGLLTVNVRITLGIIFGITLLFVGNSVHKKTAMANYERISQALTGAGLADLYICIFAATSLYHIVPTIIGFLGMAVVTALAVILSLQQGMPIALLGLLGGLLTPALIQSNNPSAFLLFTYLYLIMLGVFAAIKKQEWWSLAIPTMIGIFLWVLYWLIFCFTAADSLWLGLFIIAISVTYVLSSKKAIEANTISAPQKTNLTNKLNYFILGASVILMGIIGHMGGLSLLNWGLFGLLAVGGIALAYFKQKIYSFVPWLSMLTIAVMLFTWQTTNIQLFTAITLTFAIIYCLSGYLLIWRSPDARHWAGIMSATAVIYFIIAYLALFQNPMNHIPLFNVYVWGALAFILSILSACMVWQSLNQQLDNKKYYQQILAIFVLTAVTFFSLGIAIILKQEYLPIAFAAQICAISWINTKTQINALRPAASILLGVFILLLIPQLLILANLIVNSIFEFTLDKSPSFAIANSPVFQLGLPAVLFILARNNFLAEKDDKLVAALEFTSITLFVVMIYCTVRHLFHFDGNWIAIPASFLERGIITNLWLLLAVICIWIGRRHDRKIVFNCGLIHFCMSIGRLIYFDILLQNPLWSHQFVGPYPVLNALLLTFALPLLWIYLADKELILTGYKKYTVYFSIFSLALLFIFLSLTVRQLFQGGYLDSANANNSEIYTYSAIWLLLSIGLLFIGTLYHDKTVRVASLIIMILAVAKVFLYDAAALTGLYRVASFLGLGFILIGISWFYTRFVFTNKNRENESSMKAD